MDIVGIMDTCVTSHYGTRQMYMPLQFKVPQEKSAEPTIRVRQCPGVWVRELVASMILVCLPASCQLATCCACGVENQSSPPTACLLLHYVYGYSVMMQVQAPGPGSGPGSGSQISGLGRADGDAGTLRWLGTQWINPRPALS